MKIFKLQLFLFITFIFINCYVGRCYSISNPFSSIGPLQPVNYCKESSASESCQPAVKLYVDKLTSPKTVISHDYKDIDFCAAPPDVYGDKHDTAEPLPYKISFMEDMNCALLCQKTYDFVFKASDVSLIRTLQEAIFKGYQHHWLVDSIPVLHCHEEICSIGFPLGCYVDKDGILNDACPWNATFSKTDTFYLFNHVDIEITYQSGEDEFWGDSFKDNGGRIIGVKVQPRSISNSNADCSYDSSPMEIPNDLHYYPNTPNISYTYSVTFVKDNTVKWSSRWDNILDALLLSHFKSSYMVWLISPFMMVVFLSFMVAAICFCTLFRKNPLCQVDSTVDWKPAYADVCRLPQKKMLFSVLIGSGVQVFLTTLLILCFAWIGFLPIIERKTIAFCNLILCTLLGSVAGFVSSRLYSAFGGVSKQLFKVFSSSIALCPVSIFALYILSGHIFWTKGIYDTDQYIDFLLLLVVCSTIAPLTYFGIWVGFQKESPKPLVPPPQTVEISKDPECMFPARFLTICVGSMIISTCISFHLNFILSSFWNFELNYALPSLLCIFLMLVIVASEVALISCYFNLFFLDYHWWWAPFLTAGASGCMVLSYCIYFYFAKTEISDAVSTFSYFGWSMIFALLYTVMTGSIGFYSAYWYIKRLYGERKIFPSNWRKEAFAVYLRMTEKMNPKINLKKEAIAINLGSNEKMMNLKNLNNSKEK